MMLSASTTVDYRAFGVLVRSDIPLWPTERQVDGEPDIRVILRAPATPPPSVFRAGARDTTVTLAGVGALRVRDGSVIDAFPAVGATQEVLSVFAAGAGLAMALTQRGLFVLHGSCIEVDGAAVCIAGPSGAGKSTLAAVMVARGHRLVCDGMTALRVTESGQVMAAVGPSVLKVWPETARHLGWDVARLPPVTHLHDKRFAVVPTAVGSEEVAVNRVFTLAPGGPVARARLGPQQAVMELVRHTFLMEFCDEESAAFLFDQATAVAARTTTMGLSRGECLADAAAAAALLESGH